MCHGWRAVAAAILVSLTVAAPAAAEHRGRYVPSGLDSTVESAHFVVHYNPATYSLAQAQALRDDLEESHSKLVTGAGGTPNAGLAAPPADGDGKTDAYISRPAAPGWESFSGGVVFGDEDHFSSYMFMTPNLSRGSTRFRSAHEYMHVIQRAYFGGGTLLTESTANWASEWALPDVDPQDAFFDSPFLPLDCSYGTFTPAGGSAESCGNGYWQWSFMWRLSQRFGVQIIDRLLDEIATDCSLGCSPAHDRAALADVIAAQPGTETLATMYAEYARDVWAPARWNTGPLPTTAMQAIHNLWGEPAATTVTAEAADTGTRSVTVDHLSTRYVRVRNDGAYVPTGPDDFLRIDIGRPAGQTAPFHGLTRGVDDVLTNTPTPAGGQIVLEGDRALTTEVILPITNDSSTDGRPFTYRVRFERGTPTPPANDTKGGAVTVARGVQATASNVYAGGRGNVDEAIGCPLAQDATRGVWFRFTTEEHGVHTYSAQGSDFGTVVSLHRADNGAFAGCGGAGTFSGEQSAGTTYDVYVGRRASDPGFGSTARLFVNGPQAGVPSVAGTLPVSGAVLGERRPAFAGVASARPGDGQTVTVRIWPGNGVSGLPVQTLTAQRDGTAWQVVAGEPLPDGTYVWNAEQVGATGAGRSEYRSFIVRADTGGPQPPPRVDSPIGGPSADAAACLRARTAYSSAKRKVAAARKALKRARGAKKRRAAKRRLATRQRALRRATAQRRRLCP